MVTRKEDLRRAFILGMMWAAGAQEASQMLDNLDKPDATVTVESLLETPGEALMRDHGIEVIN